MTINEQDRSDPSIRQYSETYWTLSGLSAVGSRLVGSCSQLLDRGVAPPLIGFRVIPRNLRIFDVNPFALGRSKVLGIIVIMGLGYGKLLFCHVVLGPVIR